MTAVALNSRLFNNSAMMSLKIFAFAQNLMVFSRFFSDIFSPLDSAQIKSWRVFCSWTCRVPIWWFSADYCVIDWNYKINRFVFYLTRQFLSKFQDSADDARMFFHCRRYFLFTNDATRSILHSFSLLFSEWKKNAYGRKG